MMRKISLAPYLVGNDLYDVKGSLISILFCHKLGPADLVEYDRIAKLIEESEIEIQFTEKEYEKIKWCVESNPGGYVRQDLEFVERVLNAEEITMEE